MVITVNFFFRNVFYGAKRVKSAWLLSEQPWAFFRIKDGGRHHLKFVWFFSFLTTWYPHFPSNLRANMNYIAKLLCLWWDNIEKSTQLFLVFTSWGLKVGTLCQNGHEKSCFRPFLTSNNIKISKTTAIVINFPCNSVCFLHRKSKPKVNNG